MAVPSVLGCAIQTAWPTSVIKLVHVLVFNERYLLEVNFRLMNIWQKLKAVPVMFLRIKEVLVVYV